MQSHRSNGRKPRQAPKRNAEVEKALLHAYADTAPPHVVRWQRRAMARGNWFPVYRPLLVILPNAADAVILCDLMDRAWLAEEKNRLDGQGYFLCTSKYLSKWGWSENRQRGCLQRLKSRGFIDSKRAGVLGTRRVRVNYNAINRAIDEHADSS